jgi:hypothetical protein
LLVEIRHKAALLALCPFSLPHLSPSRRAKPIWRAEQDERINKAEAQKLIAQQLVSR